MKVPTRRFGRTEVEIPVLSCGGMRYQQSWNDMDAKSIIPAGQENIEAVIHQALDYGINHIETARGYGTSEMQLGWVLPIDRDKLLIQTKIYPFAEDGKSLREIFEISLRYLNLEYVDFLSIHGINHPQHLEQCLQKGVPWMRYGLCRKRGEFDLWAIRLMVVLRWQYLQQLRGNSIM